MLWMVHELYFTLMNFLSEELGLGNGVGRADALKDSA